jgi:hypothetical protein
MEHKHEVSDEKLLEIARKAIQAHFLPADLEDIELVLKKREPNRWEGASDLNEPAVVSVWIIHNQAVHSVTAEATTAANRDMWSELQKHDDGRIFLLYNRYPNDPAPRKTAA